ncbi:MAG: hypothetical protein AAF723_02690, partial [Pseudomonadota bacterium]
MKIINSLRGGLLLTSACSVLAACSGSGEVSNNGSTGSVTVGGGSSGGGAGSTNAQISFIPDGFTCPVGTTGGTITSGTTDIQACLISEGTIISDLTLPGTSGNKPVGYILNGSVFVGQNPINNAGALSATLTIEPGAILMGLNGEDALIVSPGSKIEAVGNEFLPIIMTSASDAADGNVSDGLVNGSAIAKGEWGGLVINGLAPINDCLNAGATPGAADCNKAGEGNAGLFGGNDPQDDSGQLSYVRVQYAGFRFNGEDELNGIAFQGVGDETVVDHIHVHNGNDDGVEFFGGTVDASYVVVTGADDDSIDWTDGWLGDLQFAVVVQDDASADRGIEADNRGNEINVGTAQGLRSKPNVANFTFVGSSAAEASPQDGIKLRAGTDGVLANGIVVGFGLGDGLDYDDDVDYDDNGTVDDVSGATPEVFSLFVAENGTPFDSDGGVLFNAASSGNVSGSISPLTGVFTSGPVSGVTPTDISTEPNNTGTTNDITFANYIGAFDPATEDASDSWMTGWVLPTALLGAEVPGCPTGTFTSSEAVPAGRFENNICVLPNEIASNLTLTRGNLYTFSGSVFVGQDLGPDEANPIAGRASATLTIEPGVTVYGAEGEDAIIVTRGSKLEAAGAQDAPIIFTSLSDINGTVTEDAKGEWGGLVINGRAPINDCLVASATPGTIGCEKAGEGNSGLFGGDKADDDSGELAYVQVRYAGFRFNGEDELNGIAFQGVGNGTDVNYIQVHNGNDDGVEFFGGTVDAKYVIVTGADDDSIDWTDGWQGSLQYALVVQDDFSADRGIEGDNRGNDINVGDAQNLRTFPTVSNFTFFGSGAAAASPQDGIKLRAGTDGILLNGIVVGFGLGDGIDYDDDAD